MDNKLPLSKPLIMVILGVIFAITIGGYVLFFQSQKRIVQKDQEYELLKNKISQMEAGYNDIQKKYDDAVTKLKQVTKDHDQLVKTSQESKAKYDELQAKYDELLISQEKLNNALKEKSNSQSTTTTNPSTPTTPKASDTHPIQELNQPSQDSGVKAEPTPPTTEQPPPPPPSDKKASLNQPSASSAGVTLEGEYFRCPTPEIVTKNLANGNWTQGSINWWVDYSRRPLNENEVVHNLFQILFEGQTIACYYQIAQGDDSAWIVIKGSSQVNKIILKEGDGWTPCPTTECEATCAKQSIQQCHFTLQK